MILREHELPEEVQGEFAAMSRAMHSARALPGDSVVRASVRKFSNEQAQGFATLIVRTYVLQLQSLAATPVGPARLGEPLAQRAAVGGPAGAWKGTGAPWCRPSAPAIPEASFDLEFDGVPALSFFVARLELDGIHQRPLIPSRLTVD